jgi:hypothetical protein
MGKAQKGSRFERKVCVDLSKWWTNGKRDDVFWRSAGSGARAKTRGRRGKMTYGQSGDVAAIDPIGDPLIDFLTIELKKGYSKFTLSDLIDKPTSASQQIVEKWIQQAKESHDEQGSLAWLLIVERNRRLPFVVMPAYLSQILKDEGCWIPKPLPFFIIRTIVRFDYNHKGKNKLHSIYHDLELAGTTLSNFLKGVSPDLIKKLVKEM